MNTMMNAQTQKFNLAAEISQVEKEYGLSGDEQDGMLKGVLENRQQYEVEICESILSATQELSRDNIYALPLGLLPEWPNEEVDRIALAHKDLFLKWLLKKRLLSGYKTEVRIEGDYSEFDILCAVLIIENRGLLRRYVRQTLKKNQSGVVYRITFTKSRELILNGKYRVAKTDFDTENNNVFDYLYKRPNQVISIKTLKRELRKPLKKSAHSIVNGLGFKGELRGLFFDKNKHSIMFRNPITESMLEELKPNEAELKHQIESLPLRSAKVE